MTCTPGHVLCLYMYVKYSNISKHIKLSHLTVPDVHCAQFYKRGGNNVKVERKPSESDSIKCQISSKTSRGKRDRSKRYHQRHHRLDYSFYLQLSNDLFSH